MCRAVLRQTVHRGEPRLSQGLVTIVAFLQQILLYSSQEIPKPDIDTGG